MLENLRQNDKLKTTLYTEKPNSKLFWKISKQILKVNNSTQSVPTLKHNNEIAETDIEKASMLNNYFASHSLLSTTITNLFRQTLLCPMRI